MRTNGVPSSSLAVDLEAIEKGRYPLDQPHTDVDDLDESEDRSMIGGLNGGLSEPLGALGDLGDVEPAGWTPPSS